MTGDRNALTHPRRRLPALSLPALGAGAATRIRLPGRKAPILVLVHGPDCSACRSHLERLAEHHGEIAEWDGRLLAVVGDGGGTPEGGPWREFPFPVLSDPDGRLASALSIHPPATVVADQWGEIHAAEEAGDDHRFLPPEELVEWARYLAVQCPECQGEAL